MSFCEELYKLGLKMVPASFCKNQGKDEFYRRNLKDISFYPHACPEMLIWGLLWSRRHFINQSVVLAVGKKMLLETGGTVRVPAASVLWFYFTATLKTWTRVEKQRESQGAWCIGRRRWWWLQGRKGRWEDPQSWWLWVYSLQAWGGEVG